MYLPLILNIKSERLDGADDTWKAHRRTILPVKRNIGNHAAHGSLDFVDKHETTVRINSITFDPGSRFPLKPGLKVMLSPGPVFDIGEIARQFMLVANSARAAREARAVAVIQ